MPKPSAFHAGKICASSLATGVLVCLGMLGACESDGPSQAERERTRTEGETLFGSNSLDGTGSTPAAPWATWSIVLGVYEPAARARAQESLDWIRSVGGLTEARLERRGAGLVVAYGVYDSADDPSAQADLTRLRGTIIDGTRPYAGAMLAPPIMEQGGGGGNPDWDLAGVKASRGPDALYTLQIGIYGRADGQAASPQDLATFRASAERAVAEMRSRGEEAFYYHGRERSTVTVGVFGPSDFDPIGMPGFQSPPLRRAWEAYPHNLFNGQAIRETVPGVQEPRLQPSRMVEIPG